ncbi:MAG: DNA-J related domain-containing protein [Gammaproteobacteria bacterium]
MSRPEPTEFSRILLELLRLHPGGLSEYALLQRLRGDARLDLGPARLDDLQELFRTHFLLFHALYRLRDQLHETRAGDLEIHVLNIRWLDRGPDGGANLARPDPLRDYYLDLDNLDGTTRADLDALLGRFWAGLSRYDRRGEALAVLDLPAETDLAGIRRQYRRLAMRHHPDRGGDPGRLQAIHTAMAILDPRRHP